MNVDFKDIDISTTATPDQVLEIFPDADGRYKELGCVELKEGKIIGEVKEKLKDDETFEVLLLVLIFCCCI